jgi:catechol 2,3-dioxygenase-like lactoylglutathione lyase family enzyme
MMLYMLGHLGINVPNLATARSYYATIMPLLDFEPFFDTPDEFAYMPAHGKRGTFLFFYPATGPAPYDRVNVGLQHLAFMVSTRQRVRDAHAVALSLGSAEVHAPQEWPQYPPPYYASFWLDPFGFMLEAVCHHDRES